MSLPNLRKALSTFFAELRRVLLEDDRLAVENRVAAREALAAQGGARFADGEVAEQAEPFDRLAHGARDLDQLPSRPLHAAQRDEATQNLVGPFEDQMMRASRRWRS